MNGSLFYMHRMVAQYLHKAYRLGQANMSQSQGFAGH